MVGRWRLRLRLARTALRSMGLRALLAIAAVAVGVAAATLRLAVTAGAAHELAAAADRDGRDLLLVSAVQVARPPGFAGGRVTARLDLGDAAALAHRVPGLVAAVPVVEGSFRAVLGRRATTTTVRGVPPEYLRLRRFEVVAGRAHDTEDERLRRRVAVVGAWVARRLEDGAPVVGRTLRLGGVPFEIVGVLAEKGVSADGQNEDDQVIVPFETARRRLLDRRSLARLVLQAASREAVATVGREARAVLRERHRLAADARDDFDLVPLLRSTEIRRRAAGFLAGMAGIFAVATLVVGGAGVAALFWLQVGDRTPEIGLRMAVGARRRDVAATIAGEALALGAAGGVTGLVTGLAAAALAARALDWQLAVAPRGVALPFALALALGAIAGLAPALRAARIAPVAALRDR